MTERKAIAFVRKLADEPLGDSNELNNWIRSARQLRDRIEHQRIEDEAKDREVGV